MGVVGWAKRLPDHRRSRPLLLAILVFLAVITPGCKPFNVKPRVQVPGAANGARAEANGVTIVASVIRDEDWLNDTFDANLILAGIVPVRVELKNATQLQMDLSKVRFELKTEHGQRFGAVDSERAFKQALSFYELSAWSKTLYKESRADFVSYGLDTKTPAAAGESRIGLVFFLVPGGGAFARGFTLVASKLPDTTNKHEGRVEVKMD